MLFEWLLSVSIQCWNQAVDRGTQASSTPGFDDALDAPFYTFAAVARVCIRLASVGLVLGAAGGLIVGCEVHMTVRCGALQAVRGIPSDSNDVGISHGPVDVLNDQVSSSLTVVDAQDHRLPLADSVRGARRSTWYTCRPSAPSTRGSARW